MRVFSSALLQFYTTDVPICESFYVMNKNKVFVYKLVYVKSEKYIVETPYEMYIYIYIYIIG